MNKLIHCPVENCLFNKYSHKEIYAGKEKFKLNINNIVSIHNCDYEREYYNKNEKNWNELSQYEEKYIIDDIGIGIYYGVDTDFYVLPSNKKLTYIFNNHIPISYQFTIYHGKCISSTSEEFSCNCWISLLNNEHECEYNYDEWIKLDDYLQKKLTPDDDYYNYYLKNLFGKDYDSDDSEKKYETIKNKKIYTEQCVINGIQNYLITRIPNPYDEKIHEHWCNCYSTRKIAMIT